MYNSLVEKCFKDCVESFRRKDLESSEEKVGTCRSLFGHVQKASLTHHLPGTLCYHICMKAYRMHFACLLHYLWPCDTMERLPRRCVGDTAVLPSLQCVQRCCEKFMKHSSRVGVRFAELSAQAEQQVQSMVGQ